jgi:hypothetical protein
LKFTKPLKDFSAFQGRGPVPGVEVPSTFSRPPFTRRFPSKSAFVRDRFARVALGAQTLMITFIPK